jgi:hypothetical protein
MLNIKEIVYDYICELSEYIIVAVIVLALYSLCVMSPLLFVQFRVLCFV